MLREYIKQLDKLPQKAMANCLEVDSNKPIIGIISAQNELVGCVVKLHIAEHFASPVLTIVEDSVAGQCVAVVSNYQRTVK